MIKRWISPLCFLMVMLPAGVYAADEQGPHSPIGVAEQKAVIDALSKQLKTSYVFPDVAQRVATSLIRKVAAGGYATANTVDALAQALSKDLRELGNDGHFRVRFDPNFRARPADASNVPSAEELAEMQQMMQRLAYGIQRVEQLQGNVGYLELRGFGPAQMVSEAYSAAISLLQGTDALIIDLRRNGGGEPASVAYFMSHFFAEGDERHLNDLYNRVTNTTQQYWTIPAVTTRYNKPVYVLTAPRTFSGAEECAYDFQTQKRATLVGETTGGGANAGDYFALAHGLVAFIPTSRAINPITKTNWERVGVKPDIEVPAEKALHVAHVAALKQILASSTDPRQREELTDVAMMVEKGELDPPNYQLRK